MVTEAMRYIYDIKSGLLLVRENEISLQYTSGLLALRICTLHREHCPWESRPLH